MKLTTSVFGVLAALALSAQAATVSVGNLPGNVPVPIVGTDGATLASGSVAIGIFSQDPSGMDIPAVKAAFQQFGTSVSMGFNGLAGLYQNTVTSAVADGGPFAGQAVYTVIGDGADIASSNGLMVFDHGFSFVADPGATPDAIITAGGNLVLGSVAAGVDIGGSPFDGFQLAGDAAPIIPEPSSALLGLLGLSFVCLRRRK